MKAAFGPIGLTALILLYATSVWAEWTLVGPIDNGELYVDYATIRETGNLVKVWTMFDYAQQDGKAYLSTNDQLQIDCDEEQYRLLFTVGYSGNMGSGKHTLPTDRNPSVWTPIPPGSIVETLLKAVCKSHLMRTYGESISRNLKRYMTYPPLAKRRGWEGTAEVLLQIADDGNVTGMTLGKSSGYAILDEEALAIMRRASPLPQAPPDLRGREFIVNIPIAFRLY